MSYVPFSSTNPATASEFVTASPTKGLPWLRDYQHAKRLYLLKNLAPKAGFLYFIDFNVNDKVKTLLYNIDPELLKLSGLLAKTVQLPKFKITNDILNQYNRKTNVQTKINYEPVRIEFHDDYSSNTNRLWQNYYRYHYEDSSYAPDKVGSGAAVAAFSDTKFGNQDYAYGYRNFKQQPFFTSIDIYVLHQEKFTSISLINPTITAWDHDTLDQTDSLRMLKNTMTLMYEDVFYDEGTIQSGLRSSSFTENGLYDHTPSLLYSSSPRSNVGNGNAEFKDSQFSNVKPPSTGALTRALLNISTALRNIDIARQVLNNRHQAWQVYGFNIKTVVTNKLADAVFAAAASVTTQPLAPPGGSPGPEPTAESNFLTSTSPPANDLPG